MMSEQYMFGFLFVEDARHPPFYSWSMGMGMENIQGENIEEFAEIGFGARAKAIQPE